MGELIAAGFVHVSGRTNGVYRYVDDRLLRTLRVKESRKSHDEGWRQIRARCGGLERALKEAQRKRDEARAQVASLTARPTQTVDDVVAGDKTRAAWLRTESLHAIACVDGAEFCDRCARLKAVLDDGDGDDVVDATTDALESAAEMRAGVTELLAATRDAGPGARARFGAALERLEAVL